MLDVRLSSMGFFWRLWISFSGSLFVGVVFFPSSLFMGVMLFPSLWLGNASRMGGGGGGGGGVVHALRRTPCFPSVYLPLSYTSLLLFSFLLFSGSTAFSSASSSFSLLCPHLFFLFSSFLSSFHYVFLLCLPSPSFFFLKSTTFSSIPIFFFFSF